MNNRHNPDCIKTTIIKELIKYGRCSLLLTPNNKEIDEESILKVTIIGGDIDTHVTALLTTALHSNVNIEIVEQKPETVQINGIKGIRAVMSHNGNCGVIDDLYEYLEYEVKTRLSQSYPKWLDLDIHDERSNKGFNALPIKQTYTPPINRKSKRY